MSLALALFIASASNDHERNETLQCRGLVILHYATTHISYLLHELLAENALFTSSLAIRFPGRSQDLGTIVCSASWFLC